MASAASNVPTAGEKGFLERRFDLTARGTTARREVLAGMTTFLVMAYIIFVNPSILAFAGVPDLEPLGLPLRETAAATCLVAGVMTIAMGLYANYPFALAPGLGINAFVAFTLVAGMKLTWEQAMGVIFYEGVIIAILVLTNVRTWVMEAIPVTLKRAIGVGIGLFISFIGATQAGYIKAGKATPLTYGSLTTPTALIATFGLLVTAVLILRRIRGALLIGIVLATAAGIIPGLSRFPASGARFITPSVGPIGHIDYSVILDLALWPAIFAVLLSDFFDTMGTVVAVGGKAGLLDEKHSLPRLNRVLLIDSLAAIVGGLCRTSSATTYIESAAGVAEGGRTGLTAVVTGLLFLLALPLSPLAGIVPAAATAPALIIVGFLMMSVVKDIPWSEPIEALPAFATMLFIPLTYSITRGIGYGFILYTALRTFAGRHREVHPLLYLVSLAFILEFAFRPI